MLEGRVAGAYASKHFGTGEPARADLGWVLLAGVSAETRGTLHLCGEVCRADERAWEQSFGVRAAAGYDGPLIGGRLGFVYTVRLGDDQEPDLPFPDVQVRVRPVDAFALELGLGAYDASTTLRPGAYGGVRVRLGDRVEIAAHAGLHASAPPVFESTQAIGVRLDADLEVEVARGFALGAGVAHHTVEERYGPSAAFTELRASATVAAF